jgi:hypothetical protein
MGQLKPESHSANVNVNVTWACPHRQGIPRREPRVTGASPQEMKHFPVSFPQGKALLIAQNSR